MWVGKKHRALLHGGADGGLVDGVAAGAAGSPSRGRSLGGLPPTLMGAPGLAPSPPRSTLRPATTEAAIMLDATNETDLDVSLATTTAGRQRAATCQPCQSSDINAKNVKY